MRTQPLLNLLTVHLVDSVLKWISQRIAEDVAAVDCGQIKNLHSVFVLRDKARLPSLSPFLKSQFRIIGPARCDPYGQLFAVVGKVNTAEKISGTYLRLNGFFTLEQFTVFIEHGKFNHVDFIGVRLAASCENVDGFPMQVDNELFDLLPELMQNIPDAKNVTVSIAAEVKSNKDKDVPIEKHLKYLESFFGGVQPLPLSFRKTRTEKSIETTLRFYVGQNAAKTSAILWEAHRVHGLGTNLGTSGLNREGAEPEKSINTGK